LVGKDSIRALDFVTTLDTNSYQWAYGCGGGSYTSCGGVGVTADFVNHKQFSVFNMLFGSYYGDWDSKNNLMRGLLASEGTALSCA